MSRKKSKKHPDEMTPAEKHIEMMARYKRHAQKIATSNAKRFDSGEVSGFNTDRISLRFKTWHGKTADTGLK